MSVGLVLPKLSRGPRHDLHLRTCCPTGVWLAVWCGLCGMLCLYNCRHTVRIRSVLCSFNAKSICLCLGVIRVCFLNGSKAEDVGPRRDLWNMWIRGLPREAPPWEPAVSPWVRVWAGPRMILMQWVRWPTFLRSCDYFPTASVHVFSCLKLSEQAFC